MNEQKKTGSKAGWVNLVLIPVKQHVGCCVLLPMAANAMGGSAAAWLATEQAEWALFAAVPPAVTFGVMKAEQAIHDYHHRRQAHKTHECACEAKTLTGKNYLKQTALAYLFYAAAHLVTHQVAHWGHEHEGEHATITKAILTEPPVEKCQINSLNYRVK